MIGRTGGISVLPERRRIYRLIKKVVPKRALSLLMRWLPSDFERRLNRMMSFRLLAPLEAFLARRSEVQQKKARPHVERQQLIEDLEKCGFPEGCNVFIHSSLKSLGWVIGGARTVIDALAIVVVERFPLGRLGSVKSNA